MFFFDYLKKITNRIYLYIYSPNLALKIKTDIAKIFKKKQEEDNNIFLKFENIYHNSHDIQHENINIDELTKKRINNAVINGIV